MRRIIGYMNSAGAPLPPGMAAACTATANFQFPSDGVPQQRNTRIISGQTSNVLNRDHRDRAPSPMNTASSTTDHTGSGMRTLSASPQDVNSNCISFVEKQWISYGLLATSASSHHSHYSLVLIWTSAKSAYTHLYMVFVRLSLK